MAFAGSAPASRPAFAAVTLGLLLPGACATASARDLVWISVSGDRDCVIAFDDRRFTLPLEAAQMRAGLRGLARRSQGAVVGEVNGETSFACWSTAVHALRDLGFRRLGLISGFETDAQQPQETPPEIVSGSLPPTR